MTTWRKEKHVLLDRCSIPVSAMTRCAESWCVLLAHDGVRQRGRAEAVNVGERDADDNARGKMNEHEDIPRAITGVTKQRGGGKM
jgi:hypothetical protein